MSIADMIDSTADDGVIVLTENVEEAVTTPVNRTLTIDLNGFQWTAPENEAPLTVLYSDITIRNGHIKSKGNACIRVGCKNAEQNSFATLGKDLTLECDGHAGVFLGKAAHLLTEADISSVNGWGISGNGSRHTDIEHPENNRDYSGNECIIAGGVISSRDGPGIYWPQEGRLVVNSGVITGTTGIELRAGTAVVKSGTISGTGSFSAEPSGNGASTSGVGLAVVQHDTCLPIDLTITGGTFEGKVALYEGNLQHNPQDSVDQIEFDVTGGDFRSSDADCVVVEDVHRFIKQGTFNGNVPVDAVDPAFVLMIGSDGIYRPANNIWMSRYGGVANGNMWGYKKVLLRKKVLDYTQGGINMPVTGMVPVAVAGASAKGGLQGWYDPKTCKILLYRNGAEAVGLLEDVSLFVIGE